MGELTRRSFVAAAAAAASYGGSAAAQNAPLAAQRIALKGYDPVSYFTDGKPEKGSSEFTFALSRIAGHAGRNVHRDYFRQRETRIDLTNQF